MEKTGDMQDEQLVNNTYMKKFWAFEIRCINKLNIFINTGDLAQVWALQRAELNWSFSIFL